MSLSAAEVSQLKFAPAVEGVLPVLLERWSPRSFADRPVSSAQLASIFEAVRWTASSYNEQPWRFVVGVQGSGSGAETYKKIFDCLIGFNQSWAQLAPVLILGTASTKFSHNGKPNDYAIYDLGAASTTLKIEATSLGLFTHSMAGFDHAAVRAALNIPEEYAIGAVTALGYQGEPERLGNEQLIAQEVSPRQRKALNEFVFSEWEKSASLA